MLQSKILQLFSLLLFAVECLLLYLAQYFAREEEIVELFVVGVEDLGIVALPGEFAVGKEKDVGLVTAAWNGGIPRVPWWRAWATSGGQIVDGIAGGAAKACMMGFQGNAYTFQTFIAAYFTGTHNGKMQHQIADDRNVCPGDLHQLAGVDINGLGIGIHILHRYDGGFLPGKLHQMITVSKESKAEGDGSAADEKEHQQANHKGEKADRDIHAPGDFKFIMFCIFHNCAPQVSSR